MPNPSVDSELTYELHLVDLRSRASDGLLALNGDSEPGWEGELTLDQLSNLRGGVGLVDAMVSSSILMVIVAQSTQLFGHSMDALGNGKLRDGLNAAISADLELVRHEVSDWARHSGADGQLAYQPTDEACRSATLGESLLADKQAQLPPSTSLDLTALSGDLKGVRVLRTMTVAPENRNLIKISYVTAPGSVVKVDHSAVLSPPAQGWCS